MKKRAIYIGLGDWYEKGLTGYPPLHFVYNNIKSLDTTLQLKGWIPHVPMVDEATDVVSILTQFDEVLKLCANDDWVLLYYTGHGNKYFFNNADTVSTKTYCVNYTPNLKYSSLPALDEFFSEINYPTLVSKFSQKVKSGHLITVLDCCFAGGVAPSFPASEQFNTIIAASSADERAYYDDNSIFFKAFLQSIDLPFSNLSASIQSIMLNNRSPSVCRLRIASAFEDSTF